MKKILVLIIMFCLYFGINVNLAIHATEITPIETDFELFGNWEYLDDWDLTTNTVAGNLTAGYYSGWVGIYKYHDIELNRVYIAVLSQVKMQPAAYVYDHRFFNQTATVITKVNTNAVKSVKYTPEPTVASVTETYEKTSSGGFALSENGASVSLGFSVSQSTSLTTDEITVEVRSVDSNVSEPVYLKTLYSFAEYKKKTAANRSLMTFNQVHIYYVNKTLYTTPVYPVFSGTLGVTFYRVGFWNQSTYVAKTDWQMGAFAI